MGICIHEVEDLTQSPVHVLVWTLRHILGGKGEIVPAFGHHSKNPNQINNLPPISQGTLRHREKALRDHFLGATMKTKSATSAGKKPPDGMHFWKIEKIGPQAFGQELNDQGLLAFSGNRLGDPGMREIRGEQAKIAIMKSFDRVSHKTESLPLHDQVDFNLGMVVPKEREAGLVITNHIKGSPGIDHNRLELEAPEVLDDHDDFPNTRLLAIITPQISGLLSKNH